jgi:hypothetical protein
MDRGLSSDGLKKLTVEYGGNAATAVREAGEFSGFDRNKAKIGKGLRKSEAEVNFLAVNRDGFYSFLMKYGVNWEFQHNTNTRV